MIQQMLTQSARVISALVCNSVNTLLALTSVMRMRWRHVQKELDEVWGKQDTGLDQM